MVEIDCPAELISRFRALGGGVPKDPLAESARGDAYRERLARQQYAMDAQAKQTHAALHGLKG